MKSYLSLNESIVTVAAWGLAPSCWVYNSIPFKFWNFGIFIDRWSVACKIQCIVIFSIILKEIPTYDAFTIKCIFQVAMKIAEQLDDYFHGNFACSFRNELHRQTEFHERKWINRTKDFENKLKRFVCFVSASLFS